MTSLDPVTTVDVVVPAYNAARWIAQALESALGQEGVSVRAVVVDDGSTDRTVEVVGGFGERVRLVRQQNAGPAAARNAGAAAGSAPLIAFLDADDIWRPDFLSRHAALMGARPELALTFSDHYQFRDRGEVTVPSFLDKHAGFQRTPRSAAPGLEAFLLDRPIGDDLVDGVFVCTGALCLRRRAFEASGGFDTSLRCAEDYDLWLRICRTARVGVILAPLTGRRLHPTSASSDEVAWIEGELALAEKIRRRPDLYPPRAVEMLARRPRLLMNAGRAAEARGEDRRARGYFLQAWRAGSGFRPLVRAGLCLLPRSARVLAGLTAAAGRNVAR